MIVTDSICRYKVADRKGETPNPALRNPSFPLSVRLGRNDRRSDNKSLSMMPQGLTRSVPPGEKATNKTDFFLETEKPLSKPLRSQER